MCKRILSVLLAAFMIAATFNFALPTKVAASDPTTYVMANFDNYSASPSTSGPAAVTGGNWGLYNGNIANGDYAVGEAMSMIGRTDRSLKLVSTTTVALNTARTPAAAFTGKLALQASVLFADTTHARSILQIKNSGSTYANIVNFDASGNIKDNNNNIVGTYAANTLYNILAVVDSPNKKLDLYVNNQLVKSGSAMPANWDAIYSFKFSQTGVAGTVGSMYLDDVTIMDYVPVSSVSAPAAMTIPQGSTAAITAAALPANASVQYLQWTSSDASVASVDAAGVITAHNAGQATITTQAIDGGASADTTVTVTPFYHIQSISLPGSMDVMQGKTASIDVGFDPTNASDTSLNWTSSDPSVASVSADGTVTGLTLGQTIITATAVDGGATASTTVSVIPFTSAVTGVSLPSAVSMAEQDTIVLQPTFSPPDASNRTVTWVSDRPDIATVDGNGTVTSIMPGTATITVTTQDGNKTASTVVTVYHPDKSTWDQYDILRDKWKTTLDGGASFNTADPDISGKIASIGNTAQSYWSSLSTDPNRTYLWSDLTYSPTSSDFIGDMAARLQSMAFAYSTKGSVLYHNIALRDDILSALDWLYTNYYNETVTEYGNWFSFEIGAPLKLASVFTIFYDSLTQQQIQNYTKTVDHFLGDMSSPTSRVSSQTGANRSDMLTIEMLFAIFNKDAERLTKVRDLMSPLFPYVTSGDGMYEDGSLIMHTSVAYTGTYGGVLLKDVGNLMYMLDGTPWQVTDPKAANIYGWVTNVFEPVIYKGQTMDMVRGRAISRVNDTGYDDTVGILGGMIRLSQFAPADKADRYKKLIKSWVSANPSYNFYAGITDIALIQTLKDWMADPSIAPAGDEPGHLEMNAMVRSVHRGDEYAFGVSKSSKRVSNYELTNGENGEGWYTGDGMTYLYNSDLNQFTGDYWPTVNRYRLPGTTVDSRIRSFADVQNGDGEGRPTNAWAGGTTLDAKYGTSGMMLRPVGSNMTANKSWFMFDNEIVALGSGISDDNNLTVESVVEQRKLNGAGDNTFTVDGTVKSAALGWAETNPSVHWAHLAGNVPGSDIGYYFPDAPQLNFLREQRTGSWSAINLDGPSDLRSNNFMNIWFNHGQNPHDAQYSYVLLPGKSVAETSAYASNPDITILENSTNAHAVRNNRLNITGFNFWKDASTKVDEVTSSRASSVMLKKDAVQHTLEVAVSDPTLENTGVIDLEIDESAASVMTSDPGVLVTQLSPTIKLTVNVNGSLGKTYSTVLDIDPAKPRPETPPSLAEPVNTKEALPAAAPIAYVFDNFDSETPGNQPAGWTIDLPAASTTYVGPLSGQSDQTLRLIDLNTDESVTADRNFAAQTSKFALEWKFAVSDAGDPETFQLLDGTTAALKLNAGTALSWQDSSGQSHSVMSLQPNTWYKVKLFVDPAHHTFDIYVDNTLVATGAAFVTPAGAIDTFRAATGAGSSLVFLDDVIVYVPGAMSLINDNFDSYATGEHPGDWVVTDKLGSAPVSVVEDPTAQNKSVLLNDKDTSFSDTMYKSFAAQNGRFAAVWTFREAATGQFPSFELYSGATSVVKLQSNGTLKVVGPGGVSTDLVKIPISVWHTVRLEVDVQQNQFDIYCDGVLIKAAAPFWKAGSSVDGIKFTTGYGGPNAVMNIDNVQVYAYVADLTPPATSVVIAPSEPDGPNGWYLHPVTVSMNAADDVSGVATTQYSLDGGVTWQAYVSAFIFSHGGQNTVSYRSTDYAGNVEAVKTVAINLYVPPDAPAGLTAASGDHIVNLSWNTVTGATYYNVKRSTSPTGTYMDLANSVTAAVYTDSSAENGIAYCYAVTASNVAGESGQSNIACATPLAQGAADTQQPVWTDGSLSVHEITAHEANLAWSGATDNVEVTGYKVFTVTGATYTPIADLGNVLSHTLSGLAPNTTYSVLVQAGDAAGNWSLNGPMATFTTHADFDDSGSAPESNDQGEPTGSTAQAPADTGTAKPVASTELQHTQLTMPDGRTASQFTVSAAQLESALAASSQTQVAVLEAASGDPVVKVDLPAAELRDAASRQPDTILQIKADGATYRLPLSLWSNVPGDGVVTVTITKVSGAAENEVKRAVQEAGAQQVAAAIDFDVSVNGQAMADFNGSYVDRTIDADAPIDPAKATGVWVDADNNLHFIPSYISNNGAKAQVTIRSPHNSIYTVVQSEITFTDLQGHWAKADVELLANKLIVQGTAAHWFAPDQAITRAEFAALLVRSLGLEETGDAPPFKDISANDWFAGAVGAAQKAGLVNGFDDGTFRPNAMITREQMVAMIAKAMNFGGKKAAANREALNQFTDASLIADWAKDGAAQVLSAGIVNGTASSTFAAKENATRAQSAVMLKRMLQYMQFIK